MEFRRFGVFPCYWYPCDKIIGGHVAAQMPRIRRCFGCGAKGHRIERCPTRAGAEIRKLRKLVRTQQAISKPGREIRPRKNGQVRKHATKEYTKKRTKICAESGRTSREPAEKEMTLRVKKTLRSLETSWDVLLALGFCRIPMACLSCGAKKLEAPCEVERGGNGVVNLIVRCGERCCEVKPMSSTMGLFVFCGWIRSSCWKFRNAMRICLVTNNHVLGTSIGWLVWGASHC